MRIRKGRLAKLVWLEDGASHYKRRKTISAHATTSDMNGTDLYCIELFWERIRRKHCPQVTVCTHQAQVGLW